VNYQNISQSKVAYRLVRTNIGETIHCICGCFPCGGLSWLPISFLLHTYIHTYIQINF